jgi:hypothetical protein
MFDLHKFAAADKRAKEARRAERKAAKLAKRAARRGMADLTAGQVSADDPTSGMADRQPQIPAGLAHAIGAE